MKQARTAPGNTIREHDYRELLWGWSHGPEWRAIDWGRTAGLSAYAHWTGTGSRRSALAGLDQAGLVREDHGLHPVPQAELRQEVPHVGLHGRLADDEFRRDLRVGQAPRDVP